MLIKSLLLKNFRNLDLEVDLSPSVNFIFGNNATGKSNFLDSIYYLFYGTSFRPYSEGNDINWNSTSEFGIIGSTFAEINDNYKIVFSGAGRKNAKQFLIESHSTTRKKFTENKELVLFTPHLLNIIAGTPEDRRNDLDSFLSQVDFKYAGLLKGYKSIVRNRSKLLQRIQSGQGSTRELQFWNEKLIQDGTTIITKRTELFKILDPILDESADKLFKQSGDFALKYISKFSDESDIESAFRNKIEQNIQKEIYAGRSLYGPHRDDWELLLDGKSLKVYGSRGQQRIAALIMKFAQWMYLSEKKEYPVVILLDDIFAELDETNSENLQVFFMGLDTQIFITTANKSEILETKWSSPVEIKLS